MKRTISKIGIVLSCMMMGFAPIAKGQIYGEPCFYAYAGESEVRFVVKFEGGKLWLAGDNDYFCREHLAESSHYYENVKYTDGRDADQYEYDNSLTTSKWVVYKKEHEEAKYNPNCQYCVSGPPRFGSAGCGRHGYVVAYTEYIAFSKDKSSCMTWTVFAKRTGQPNRKTYTRIPKKDLLPKAVNYDFLNE